MENFQTIYKCVILLALVAFHEALVIQGRQIKSTKQKQYRNKRPRSDHDSSGGTRKPGSESAAVSSFDSAAPHDQYDPQTTYASHIPSAVDHSVTRSKKEGSVPPTKPSYSFSFRDSDAAHYTDDFRPTAPGSSPGVGHSFQKKEADVESKSLAKGKGVKHDDSLTGFKYYRPTAPGQSRPGVGHVFQSKNEEPNN